MRAEWWKYLHFTTENTVCTWKLLLLMQNGQIQNFVPGPTYAGAKVCRGQSMPFTHTLAPAYFGPETKNSQFLTFCIFWAQSHVLLTSNAIFSNKIGCLTVCGTFYWPNSIFYSGLCKSKWELSGGNTFISPLKTLFAHENYCNWCKTDICRILSRGQNIPPKYAFYTYFGPGILWPRDKKSHFLMFCIFWAQTHDLLTSNAIFSSKIGY